MRPSETEQDSARALMPPHLLLRDFLDEATVAELLAYAVSREADFEPTRVDADAIKPSIRISAALRDLGRFRKILKDKILPIVPELVARLRVTPFASPRLETELVAHGDGAFYTRHADTQTDRYEHVDHIRVLSGVYYFFSEPKAFSGGALRLHAIGSGTDPNFIDIEPQCNSFLVFPSWAPHNVMRVHCPSGRFIDSRFAINCWLRRKKASQA
jgi:SM-20-related protein